MRDYFSDILDEGEKVAAYFKPVKRKFFLAAILMYCVIGLIVMGFATLAIILPIGAVGSHAPIYRFIPLAVFVLGLIINCVLDVIWYKKTCYCYTNKHYYKVRRIRGILSLS